RAETLVRAEEWEPATAAYRNLLVHHAAALDKADRLGIFRQLGRVKERVGDVPRAIAFYAKALEVEPGHRTTLEDLPRRHMAQERWDEAVGNLRALADAVPPAERPQVLERLADLSHERLHGPARAAVLYLSAVELDPTNHRVLQKLL